MKTYKFLIAILLTGTFFTSCNNDDDSTPDPVNEEEVITTLTVTLTPTTVGPNIVLQTQDLDGDGPNPPVVTVSGDLTAGTTYTGTVVFLNETETPAEDITEEVEEEAEEHQVFYTPGGGLDVTTAYTDTDADGNPVGLQFTLTANTAGSGNLTVTLRHEPTKPNDGTLSDAGGETDISATFNVTIQ